MADGLSEESVARLILPRHALHACKLTAEWGGLREWRSGLPADLTRFCGE